MNFIKSSKNISKELEKIQNISKILEKKIPADYNIRKFDDFSLEELSDLHQLLSIAQILLLKYDEKKQIKSTLQEFMDIISSSVDSISHVDDEITELVLSADVALNKIKDAKNKMNLEFEEKTNPHTSGSKFFTSSIVDLHSPEYLDKPAIKSEHVI